MINYFEFTRAEREGCIVLALLCSIIFLAPDIARLVRPERATDIVAFQKEVATFRAAIAEIGDADKSSVVQEAFAFDPNHATFDDFVRLGISERVANTILNYRNKGGRFFDAEDFQKIYSLPQADFARLRDFIEIEGREQKPFAAKEKPLPLKAEYFPFDPNTATEAELRRLGLPDKTITMLLKYREKGGAFRKNEDLKKLYSLAEQDYARLVPYISIAATAPRPVQYASSAFGEKVLPKSANKDVSLDINKATVEEWQQLPGIGANRAQKILYFRDKLGGFSSAEQVAEARGLPDSVFRAIKPMLLVSTPIFRKININTATADDLGLHPYFDKKQATLLLAYRAQHGNFKSVDDIVAIGAFKNKDWLAKVKPYLGIE